MTIVKPKDGEAFEATLKRFTKKVANEGIIQEVKKRQAYEKPSDKRRRMLAAAKARTRKYQKKLDEQIAFENENKFRPRKRFDKPRPPRQDRPPDRKPPVAEKKPIVKENPISKEALENLQKKFSRS